MFSWRKNFAFVSLCALISASCTSLESHYDNTYLKSFAEISPEAVEAGEIRGDQFTGPNNRTLWQLIHLHGLYDVDYSAFTMTPKLEIPDWYDRVIRELIITLIVDYGLKVDKAVSIQTSQYSGSFSSEDVIVIDVDQLRKTLSFFITRNFENEYNYIKWIKHIRPNGIYPEHSQEYNTVDEFRNNNLGFLINDIEVAMFSSLRFTVFHEAAHIILNHHKDKLDQKNCEYIQKIENEADRFSIEKIAQYSSKERYKGQINDSFNLHLIITRAINKNRSEASEDIATPIGLFEALLPIHNANSSCSHGLFEERYKKLINLIDENYYDESKYIEN